MIQTRVSFVIIDESECDWLKIINRPDSGYPGTTIGPFMERNETKINCPTLQWAEGEDLWVGRSNLATPTTEIYPQQVPNTSSKTTKETFSQLQKIKQRRSSMTKTLDKSKKNTKRFQKDPFWLENYEKHAVDQKMFRIQSNMAAWEKKAHVSFSFGNCLSLQPSKYKEDKKILGLTDFLMESGQLYFRPFMDSEWLWSVP